MPYYRVDHVSYRTDTPWPPATAGASLERIPLEAHGNDSGSWRTGPANGTPGIPSANRPPVFTIISNPVVPRLMPLTLTLMLADLNAPWQTASFVPIQLPAASAFNRIHNRFPLTPSGAHGQGEFTARFLARDNAACGAEQTELQFTVQVTQPLTASAQYVPGGLQISSPAFPGETYRANFARISIWAIGNCSRNSPRAKIRLPPFTMSDQVKIRPAFTGSAGYDDNQY